MCVTEAGGAGVCVSERGGREGGAPAAGVAVVRTDSPRSCRILRVTARSPGAPHLFCRRCLSTPSCPNRSCN